MNLVAMVKLLVSPEEGERLLAITRKMNEASSWLSVQAFDAKVWSQIELHKRFYRELREKFGLSSQHAVRAIGKVVETYRRDKTKMAIFRILGAITFDQRNYTFKEGNNSVGLRVLDGRLTLRCSMGAQHRERLAGKRGQADLIYRDGCFFLFVSVEVEVATMTGPQGWLGVDLGIRNLAYDSDNKPYSGEETLSKRTRIGKLRARLQSKGTRSAKRHLKKLRRKEQRFHRHTNHCISKEIVRKAKDTERGIAVEDLSGIRTRVTVRKAQRTHLHGWSFFQLRSFLAYKATLAGVAFQAVDPRNTSRTCPECGCIDKANRKSQSEFVCTGCGFAAHADHVGARNIAARAEVNQPIVSNYCEGTHAVSFSVQAQSPFL